MEAFLRQLIILLAIMELAILNSFSLRLLQELQECFESQDIAKLQATIAAMPPAEARYHMKRCVESGLWKPAGMLNVFLLSIPSNPILF